MRLKYGRRRSLTKRQEIRMLAELRLGRYYSTKAVARRYDITPSTAIKYLQKSNDGIYP